MTYLLNALSNFIHEMSNVFMPDGTAIVSEQVGTMKILCVDEETLKEHIVPLHDTLYVPGLTATLWSVLAFNRAGHSISFEPERVRVTMNKPNGQTTTFFIRHVFGHTTPSLPA